MKILFTKSITGSFFILVLSAIFYFGVSGDNSVNDLDKYSATKNVLVLNTTAINKYHHGPQVSASIRMLRDLAATENWRLHEVDNLSKMNMLDHYQQTKNLYVSYSETKLGFF